VDKLFFNIFLHFKRFLNFYLKLFPHLWFKPVSIVNCC